MKYGRFFLMILTSTVVMFGLMYLNTYLPTHIFWSETRAYMAILMGATMAIVMLAFMLSMYTSTKTNSAIFVGAFVLFAGSLWLVRSQVTVDDRYRVVLLPGVQRFVELVLVDGVGVFLQFGFAVKRERIEHCLPDQHGGVNHGLVFDR